MYLYRKRKPNITRHASIEIARETFRVFCRKISYDVIIDTFVAPPSPTPGASIGTSVRLVAVYLRFFNENTRVNACVLRRTGKPGNLNKHFVQQQRLSTRDHSV